VLTLAADSTTQPVNRVFPLTLTFERHTSVVDWPKHDDPNQMKELIKLVTLEISQSPTLKLVIPDHPVTSTSAVS
jgi:hypothetical protein